MSAAAGIRLERDLANHLPAAAALHGQLFERPWSTSALADLLAVPGTAGAVAMSDAAAESGLAGFVLFRTLGDFAEILTLAVAPGHRRKGTGRHLMRHALEESRVAGAEKLILEVQDGNLAAIRLYESLGLQAFDRRRNYYKSGNGRHADAILMQLNFDN